MSLRPTDPKSITTDDLIPGDVILSCGPKDNALDNLIKEVDQGDYSHTSLYIGIDNKRPMVVEATQEGIKYNDIKVDLGAQALVDVYRYVSPQGNHLGDPGWPVQPILDRAMTFVGAKYAYDELFLGAVVMLAADRSSRDPDWRALLRLGGMLLIKGLRDWMIGVDKDGKTPMTCVEVATTAFWQADPLAHKYAMQVQFVRSDANKLAAANPLTPAEMDELRSVRSQIHAAVAKTSPHLLTMVARAAGTMSTAKTSDAPPQIVDGPMLGLCTPRDMQTSPTLKFVGCLRDLYAPPAKRAS